MSSLRKLGRRSRPEPAYEAAPERPHVAQYRELVRLATVAELEQLHRAALAALDPFVRANVLRTTQDELRAGEDLTVDDLPQLAHLLARAEAANPGVVTSRLNDAALDRLATAVLRDELAERLLAQPRTVQQPATNVVPRTADDPGELARGQLDPGQVGPGPAPHPRPAPLLSS